MSENLLFGIKFSIIGMGIVFVVLITVALIVAAIRRLDRGWKTREQKHEETALAVAPSIDDTTLVLISAAVATLLTGRHRIRSVRRVQPGAHGSSPWSVQGRIFLHGSHSISKQGKKDH
jgi:sodium pump decarboxylase gamma subunit